MPSIRVEHLAFWTRDLERLARFYETYFSARREAMYRNAAKGFESIFLGFAPGGARLELMRTTSLEPLSAPAGAQRFGLTHLALVVGSEQDVDALTARLRADGHRVIDEPRRTGDGYYESVVLDPDGNRLELTAA